MGRAHACQGVLRVSVLALEGQGGRARLQVAEVSRTALEAIRWRSGCGYPGSKGKATKYAQAKADVALLLCEIDNLTRFVQATFEGSKFAGATHVGVQNAESGSVPANDNDQGSDE